MAKRRVEDDPLRQERGYFNRIKADLQEHEGKFALIKGRKLLGVFDTPDAAYKEGLKKLGNVPMLIAPIRREKSRESIPALQLGLIHASIQS